MTHSFGDSTIRKINETEMANNAEGKAVLCDLRKIEQFLSNFRFLSFGRDFVLCENYAISLQRIMTSVELTVGSIISCCEAACLADANTLLRKYRDDLFFYLYISVYDSSLKLGSDEAKIDRMKKQIEHWLKNSLSYLHIGEILKEIGTFPKTREAVKKYDLQSFFDDIGDRLNNFVHSNGYEYYNLNVNAYSDEELGQKLRKILSDTKFITVAFLFLLILCSPLSVMSTDYIDSLACNMTPVAGSQYWVAPFVERFLADNIDLIDKNCMDYLKENTLMQFTEGGDEK